MSKPQLEIICRQLDRWPRDHTKPGDRKARPFKTDFDKTLRSLRSELVKLKATVVVVQTAFPESDVSLTTGWPRADRVAAHPGVIVAADTTHGALKWLCDDCARWTDNVHAIALTLERLRLADLYGVTGKGEQYAGWKMLPGPITAGPGAAPSMTIEQAATFAVVVAGLDVSAQQVLRSRHAWDKVYRAASKFLHQDMVEGQTSPEWGKLQDAKRLLDGLHNKR